MKFYSDIRLLLLGLWLGAACFFIAVAQSTFAVLPVRELAGAVVNRTLAVLNYSGLTIAVILILMSLVGARRINGVWLWIERFLLVVIGLACAIGEFVIGMWLSATRLQMGRPIDEVSVDDPLRVQFNILHQYSEWVLLTGMLAALIAFFIISNRKFTAIGETKSEVYDFSKEFKV